METVPAAQLTALCCRMDPFEEKLRRLRNSFNTGKTKSAKFRTEQLLSLGHFLQDNKKQLHDALTGDLGKVLGGGAHRGAHVSFPAWATSFLRP